MADHDEHRSVPRTLFLMFGAGLPIVLGATAVLVGVLYGLWWLVTNWISWGP